MRLAGRVGKLEALEAAAKAGRGGATRLLKGLEWEAVLQAVEGALDDADAAMLDAILAHVEEAARTPRGPPGDRDEEGNPIYDTHFFEYWLWGLQEGSWALPQPIPRAVLEGFNSRCGCVLWRCEDCRTGLGNGRRYGSCPVCGSANLSHKKLSGPPWDSHWQYTPLPPPRQAGER
jgi:hypothetical protein